MPIRIDRIGRRSGHWLGERPRGALRTFARLLARRLPTLDTKRRLQERSAELLPCQYVLDELDVGVDIGSD